MEEVMSDCSAVLVSSFKTPSDIDVRKEEEGI
jgi:hypothetical protein